MEPSLLSRVDWTAVAIVFATFFGPIAAVFAQGVVDERRQKKRRQRFVFETLMRTRATPLAPDQVNALNAVPLEFTPSAVNGPVRDAWKVYMHHLTKDTSEASWGTKRIDLLIDLLAKMGRTLGYKFDSVELESGAYAPKGHAAIESDQDVIRQGMAAIFRGEKTLPLAVSSFPSDPDMLALWKKVLNAVADHFARAEPPASQAPAHRPLGVAENLGLMSKAATDATKKGSNS